MYINLNIYNVFLCIYIYEDSTKHRQCLLLSSFHIDLFGGIPDLVVLKGLGKSLYLGA